jgi:hypothetical protein
VSCQQVPSAAVDRDARRAVPGWVGSRMAEAGNLLPPTLASDADRDSAASLLNEAFAEGRLTTSEHGDRVRAAYCARTWSELSQLTADLPARAEQPVTGLLPAGPDRCLLCAALILCPPAGIAWLLASRRRARRPRDRVGAVWPAAVPGEVGRRAEDR